MNHPQEQRDHWLVRPESIKLMWRIGYAVLALTIVAQLFIKVKGYFGIDGWIGFAATFGFLSCVAMVFFAKLLGLIVKRDENYYQQERTDD